MNLAKFAIEKRLVSALFSLLILASGYYAYVKLPRFEDPEFILRQAQIITPYTGASASEVANEVTDVIETAIQQLQGVKEVKSVSSPNLSEVSIEFTIASSKTRLLLNQRFTQLRAKISDITNKLPPGAGPAMVYDDFGDVFALYFAITGEGYSLPEIYTYVKSLRKELALVPGVSKVQLIGVPKEIIYVDYNPSRLIQLGLSAGKIAQLIEGQNLVVSAGGVDAGATRLTIRPTAAVQSLKQIEELVVTNAGDRSFRLKDIASVKRGLKEPSGKRLYRNGNPAIGLGISNTIGGNVVNMGNDVNIRIEELKNQRPLGIKLSAISDQSVLVSESINGFVINVILALIIVTGTLFIFMGLRSGILMGGILMVTVAGSLFGMYIYGLDMQRISLGALIIALGMLVDNAIVVVEGTLVRAQAGENPGKASIIVVEQTKWPLLGGTIVGILAFSAIGFSPDNTGEYANSLFWTIAISLLFSWLIAIWLTPYFCSLILKSAPAGKGDKKESSILFAYRVILLKALQWRWVTLTLAIVLFVSSIFSFALVKQGFFPASTRNQFVVDYTLPEGSSITRTSTDLQETGKWIRKLDSVEGTNTMVGGGHIRFMLTYSGESSNSAYGQILVDVDSYENIDDLLPKIQTYIDANYPDATAKVWKFILGPGGGSLVEARFSGSDPVVLRKLSDQTKLIFSQAGAIGVKDNWREMIKIVRPTVNEQSARRVGLSQGDISRAIAGFFGGTKIGLYREGDELRSIVFRPLAKYRNDVKYIRDVQIFSSLSGKYIPITQVVDDFPIIFENAKLRRFNKSLAITAQADPAPGINSNELFKRIQPKVDALDIPDGYALEWRGQYGNSQDANAGLASTFPFAFGAMIIVVLLQFNAIRQPLIIFLTVPLALIGVVYGLIALDTPMEFVTILGILSLTGMLIKNAIVLIDQTDKEIAQGKSGMTAVIDAAISRMRPVCLGALTTVLGMVPLLWDPFFRSLAVVIICGLGFATILTLIIVPTLYAIFFRIGVNEASYSLSPKRGYRFWDKRHAKIKS